MHARVWRAVTAALRALPVGLPGKSRLVRALCWPAFAAQNVPVVDRHGLHYVVPDAREPIAFHLLIDGVYEPDTEAVVLAALTPGATYVDVGANIGTLALPAAQRVGPTGTVVAIEASPPIVPFLTRHVAANGLDRVVRVVPVAASDTDAPVPFYCPPPAHFGMGSVGPQFYVAPITVPARPLDAILADLAIPHVDVLKVDVEGLEAQVFAGARALLTGPRPPLVLFEFCDWAEARIPGGVVGAAQRQLRADGFTLWRLADYPTRPLTTILDTGSAMLVARR